MFTDVLKQRIAADRVGNYSSVDTAWFPKRPGTSNSVLCLIIFLFPVYQMSSANPVLE